MNNDHFHPSQSQEYQQHQNQQRFTSSMTKRKQKLHEYSSASPPLTEDSGQWSSSFPSSPIKEQSPHNSGHVKSSSGSTSSCEYNNNSRKSELYGTPHWWPMEQQRQQDGGLKPSSRELGGKIGGSSDLPTTPVTAPTKGGGVLAAAVTTSAPVYKYNKALAFTISFNEDATTRPTDADDDDSPEAEEEVVREPASRASSSVSRDGEDKLSAKEVVLVLPLDKPTKKPDTDEDELKLDHLSDAEQISDAKSDNGTYTLEDDDSSYVQDDRGAALGLNQIDNNDWIQKWATEASAHVPDMQPIPPYDETFKILDETRSIVNAMQDRVSCDKKPKPKLKQEYPSSIKPNRAFNIRRTMNTSPAAAAPPSYESDSGMTRSCMSDNYSKENSFSRADGGRFSLRVKKGMQGSHSDTEVKHFPYNRSLPSKQRVAAASRPLTNSPVRSKSILGPNSIRPSSTHQSSGSSGALANSSSKLQPRSNSTITSRDIEMENWKRRKSYDPLKSAGLGVANKSKIAEDPKKKESSSNLVVSTKPLPTGVTKFVGATSSSSLTRPKNLNLQQQQQQQQLQLHQQLSDPVTPASSVHSHSPVPHDHCCSTGSASSIAGAGEFVRVQDWIQLQQQLNRSSCEQLTQRKFEALDTLVISTIFSLTNKVRNLSLGLLKKIQPGQQEDDENSALLEEMITQLSEMSTQHLDKQGQKSSSKELSGILKNVKKMEQVILVLDRVLCDQDDEESCSDC